MSFYPVNRERGRKGEKEEEEEKGACRNGQGFQFLMLEIFRNKSPKGTVACANEAAAVK